MKQRRLDRQASANSGEWPLFFTALSCRTVTSVDLDQFQGLDQIGEQGLKDKVNNHYLQILRHLDCIGCSRRGEPNHAGWWHHHDE